MPTKIEWTHLPSTTGETWNPVTGCTKISEGCTNCYAERMSKRLAGRFGYPKNEPFRVTLHEDRLEQPLRWKKPRTIFACSMSDFFHHKIPFEFQLRILQVIGQCPQHTFLILTKRVDQLEMWEYANGWHPYPNLWLGVTAENQQRADERIPILLQIPAAVRFVSVEPMLETIDLIAANGLYNGLYPGLDWVICGGETGPSAREMNPEWARNLYDQCKAAGVPFFMKQMSNRTPIPYDLSIREFPNGYL